MSSLEEDRGRAKRAEATPPTGELGHPHPSVCRVEQVRRRRSPIDPPDGCWAVVGVGIRGSHALAEFAARNVPSIGYEISGNLVAEVGSDRQADEIATADWIDNVRFGHLVIAIEEIEDLDLLAVTSRDCQTQEINTDYFAGVVLAIPGDSFIRQGLVDLADGAWQSMHDLFISDNPALLVLAESDSGARYSADGWQELVGLQAAVAARFAHVLRENPRGALAFHRSLGDEFNQTSTAGERSAGTGPTMELLQVREMRLSELVSVSEAGL